MDQKEQPLMVPVGNEIVQIKKLYFIEIHVDLQYTIITLSLVPGAIKGTSYINNTSYVTTWR